MVMASGTATLKMSTFDDAATSWERRVQICSAIEKTYVPNNNNGSPHSLDIHTNSKDMHPVDMLTRVVEAEGIKQLLMMTKKKELQKMCEHAALVDADPNDKRQMIKHILQTWTDIGTKKFLKQKVSDAQIVTICKNLGISPIPAFSISSDRNVCVEQIIRQLHIIGLENFSKKVADENVKNILEHTSKSQQPDRLQIPGKKNGDSRGERAHSGEKSGTSSTSRSSSREHGMAKSQEILKKSPKSKKKKRKRKKIKMTHKKTQNRLGKQKRKKEKRNLEFSDVIPKK